MNFIEIDEKEYECFWENHSQKTFLSSIEIGKLRKLANWNVNYVALKKDNIIIAAAMLLSIKRHLNKYEFYSPRGFLINYNDNKVYNTFLSNIKKYVKNKNGYILRIDPYIINIERDIDGNIVEKGIDNSKIRKVFKKNGFKEVKTNDLEQVSWMFSLNTENKTRDEVFNQMNSTTKYKIHKTEKFGIKIRELDYDELDQFDKIMVETGKRKDFKTRNLDYYQNMYKLFHDKKQIRFLIAEINIKQYIDSLNEEIELKNIELQKITNEKKKELAIQKINNLKDKRDSMIRIKEISNSDVIPLSASMFLLIQPEVLFLAGGNYEQYMIFNSQYLLQWEMIKYAVDNKYKKYNFYGIPANINKHPKNYGVYEFKKGFNGFVEELIGEYELPITKHYYIIKLIQKIKKIL